MEEVETMIIDPYAAAGVDVEKERDASEIMYEASLATFGNRTGRFGDVLVRSDGFAGVRSIDLSRLPPGSRLLVGSDGIGTKVRVAQRLGLYDTVPYDLLAMLVDDQARYGAEPVGITNVLDVTTLKGDYALSAIRQMAQGLVCASREADVAVLNGEIAQMGSCVSGDGPFPFLWSGTCFALAREDRLLDGCRVQPGDTLVALRETTCRSNGISLLRDTFEQAYGPEWHDVPFGASSLGRQVLAPSTIYCRLITHLHGGFAGEQKAKITGIAHISGGGIPEKLERLLKVSGLGADLPDLANPPEVLLHCQEVSGTIKDRNAYKTWSMGVGKLLATPDPDTVCAVAREFGIEAWKAGKVSREPGVSLVSRGWCQPGHILHFGARERR